MRRADLHLLASGGAREGLGHVLRCVALAQEAQAAGLSIVFSLAGDADAFAVARRELPSVDIERWSLWDYRETHGARWTLFDTPRPIGSCLRRAKASGSQRLVLDRPDHIDEAELTIIPGLPIPSLRDWRLRSGPQYCVIAQSLRSQPVASYPGERNSLVISLGGADPLDSTTKVADDIQRCLTSRARHRGAPLEVHFAIGAAFGARPDLHAKLRSRGWHVHEGLDRAEFAGLMRRARLAVLGFGTAIFEAAYLGLPALYVTHNQDDVGAARRLEALGIGRFAACGPRYESRRFYQALSEALCDEHWQTTASRRARVLMGDGDGSRRILQGMGLITAVAEGVAARSPAFGSTHSSHSARSAHSAHSSHSSHSSDSSDGSSSERLSPGDPSTAGGGLA